MSCNKIQKNISAYFDGVLSGEEKTQILQHIKKCEPCSVLFRHFQVLQKEIKSNVVSLKPPEYIQEKLFRRIAENNKVQQKRMRFYERLISWFKVFQIQFQPAIRVVEFAVVFVFALFAGIQIHQFWTTRDVSDNANLADYSESPSSADDFLKKGVQDYLEKSSIVLRQLKNEDTNRFTNASTFADEKKVARDLLIQSKLISSKIKNDSSNYIGSLINELEPIFMDVANFDQQKDRRSLDVIKQTIEDKNYLMRLEFAKTTNSRLPIRY